MNQFADQLRAAAHRAGPFGIVAALLALLALIVTLYLVGRTIIGMPWGAPIASQSLRDPTGWAERYATQLTTNHDRVAGRSPFFTPAAPPPPAPPPRVVEETEEDPGPPPPPPPPARYGGPDMIAMMGDVVWFANDKRLRVGEEDSGVTVVATNPPWKATLLWRGIEFEVPLFERTTDQFLAQPASSESESLH